MTIQRTTLLIILSLVLGGCELLGGLGGWGPDTRTGDNDEVIPVERTATSSALAHQAIQSARPQATGLFINQLSFTPGISGVSGFSASSFGSSIENSFSIPAGEAGATIPTECPYLTPSGDGGGLSCRHLTDAALALSWINANAIRLDAADQAMAGKSLTAGEQAYVQAWANEATLSGVDSGAIQSVQVLRSLSLCDQDPAPGDRAYNLGYEQGEAILEQTAAELVPDLPPEQCNTDLLASTILAEARTRADQFNQENPICDGVDRGDIIGEVDLDSAETRRRQGVEEGLTAAYEVLRVRLVNTWECTPMEETEPCLCYARYWGDGPVYCFLESDYERIPPWAGWELEDMAEAGVPQCHGNEAHAEPVGSPLVVDLDNNGINLTRHRVISFDLAGTGDILEFAAFADDDAFLALDLDGNGRIDSGVELFGNHTSCGELRCLDGVEAIAQHDSNADGVIDASDPVFERLQLWKDANQDGESSADELSPIAAHVQSISLKARVDLSWVDGFGNSAMRALNFTRVGGDPGVIHDVWFSVGFDTPPQQLHSVRITSTLPQRLESLGLLKSE